MMQREGEGETKKEERVSSLVWVPARRVQKEGFEGRCMRVA